jgi:trypsin-like peptidase
MLLGGKMTGRAAERFLRILGAGNNAAGTFTERSIRAPQDRSDVKALDQGRADEIAGMATEALSIAVESSGMESLPQNEGMTKVLADGKRGLGKLGQDGDAAILTTDETVGLEAIVIATGQRPSLALTDCGLDFADTRLGIWRDATTAFAGAISKVCSSVGRINLGGNHVGTGFAIGPGLVLTNRHVLQDIAVADENGKWRLQEQAGIDFGGENAAVPAKPFALAELVLTTAATIDPAKIDFGKIDLAVLRCEVGDRAFPERLSLESQQSDVIEGRDTYAIGFPGKPRPGAEPFSLLKAMFDFKFGVKRYSPGQIEHAHLDTDPKQTVFSHDCTTLGGSSGSAIVDLGEDGLRIIGLHFGGNPKIGNYAHSVAAIRNILSDVASYLES